MKKTELKKQTNEQLEQFILQNQKDIVAEKNCNFYSTNNKKPHYKE